MSVYPASKHCYLFDVYSDVPQDIGYWFRMRDNAVSNDFHSSSSFSSKATFHFHQCECELKEFFRAAIIGGSKRIEIN